MRKYVRVFLIALMVLPISEIPSHGAEDTLSRIAIDPTIPQVAPMIYCKNELQRDCVERVLIEHPDGTVQEAKYVTTKLVPFPDKQGQKIVYGDVIFDFNSGSRTGPLKRLRISTHVQTPEFSTDGKKWAVYWLMLQRQELPGEIIPIVNNCDGVNVKTCIPYPALDTEDKFHMYFRTSWLKPVAGGGEGIESSLQYQKIAGGMRWKFSGKEFFQPIFKDSTLLSKSATPEGTELKPDQLNPTLYAVIDHAGATESNSFWNPKCADFGFTITMSNAPMAGQLFWNYATESLIFNIYAPHLNAFGKLNTGTFHTKFHQAWLDCRFPGNTLSTATKISVQVLNEDGTPQVSTSSTSVRNGLIEIHATGFHYSSPSIVAKRSSESLNSTNFLNTKFGDDWSDTLLNMAGQSASSNLPGKAKVSLKRATITCVKGKITRKITMVKPVCPKGFKSK
jgi:hypothetical protein